MSQLRGSQGEFQYGGEHPEDDENYRQARILVPGRPRLLLREIWAWRHGYRTQEHVWGIARQSTSRPLKSTDSVSEQEPMSVPVT